MTSLLHPTTEVTRHSNWEARAFLGPKIALRPPLVVTIIQQNAPFLEHLGPKAVLMGYSALYSEIIAHIMLKSRNHEFPPSKTTNSWQS